MEKNLLRWNAPKQIKVAVGFLGVALSLGILLQFAYEGWDVQDTISKFAGIFVLPFLLHALLIAGIAKRSGIAKWISLLFFILGLIIIPPNFSDFSIEPVITTIVFVMTVLQALGYALLFSSPAAQWFAAFSKNQAAKS